MRPLHIHGSAVFAYPTPCRSDLPKLGVRGAGMDALRSCLRMLEAGGFLTVLEGSETFACDDLMLVDQVKSGKLL